MDMLILKLKLYYPPPTTAGIHTEMLVPLLFNVLLPNYFSIKLFHPFQLHYLLTQINFINHHADAIFRLQKSTKFADCSSLVTVLVLLRLYLCGF
jgi:hypothetical protein